MSAKNPRKIVSERTGEISWRARFTYISPIDGSRKFRSKNFKTQKLALAWLAEQRAAHNAGTYFEPSKMALEEFASKWLERGKHRVASSTWNGQERHWRLHVAPTLGKRPIGAIRPTEIQDLYDALSAKGLAPGTVTNIHRMLRQIFAAAVRDGLVPFNPTSDRQLPRATREVTKYWTEDEVRRFLEVSANHPSHNLWRLLLNSGMRIGEALALTWDDIDTERRRIHVNKTLRRELDGRMAIGKGAKTATSNRTIFVPASTILYMHRQRAQNERDRELAGDAWKEHNLVFPSPRNGTFRVAKPYQTMLRRLAIRANVTVITPHGMRHTYATLALRQGVSMKVVQKQLGHATLAMTADLYSHVDDDLQALAAEAMERLFPVDVEALSGPQVSESCQEQPRVLPSVVDFPTVAGNSRL